MMCPLSLEMGESLYNLTGEEPGREKLLSEPFNGMRKKLVYLLGLNIQPFKVSRNTRLKKDEYRILFKEIEAGRGRVELSWYPGATNSGIAEDGSWLDRAAFPDLINNPANLRAAVKATSSMLVHHVHAIIQRRAPELLGRDEVAAILDSAEEKYPVVTGEVKNLLSLGVVREILQGLVSEQVSIRHIAVILETLADWGSFGPAPSEVIIEQIRQSLKRQICLEYADEKLTLRVLTLEPKLEKSFTENSPPPGAETSQAVNQKSDENTDWAELFSPAVRRMEEKGYPPVILCSPRLRFPIKEATRMKLPELAVLSYMEIPSDICVEPLGEIRLEGNIRFLG